jgi:hypothetical protein
VATDSDSDLERIQSRPLPAPPAPRRSGRHQQQQSAASPQPPSSDSYRTTAGGSGRSPRPPQDANLLSVSSDAGDFLSARSSATSRTLVGSDVERQRAAAFARAAGGAGRPLSDDEDTTLADSVVDSMHSCADDTLMASGHGGSGGGHTTGAYADTEDEVTLHEDVDDVDFPDLAHDDLGGHLSPEERMHRLARRMDTGHQQGNQHGCMILYM